MEDGSNNGLIMKKILYMIIAAALLVFTGCREKDEVQHRIVGEWLYSTEESGQAIEIYVAFNIDWTFDMYQKIGEGAHRYYKGNYEVERTLVSGSYSDGTPWASDYDVSFLNGDMIMKSVQNDGYSITYKKAKIPAEVRDHCVVVTKSSEEGIAAFL